MCMDWEVEGTGPRETFSHWCISMYNLQALLMSHLT
jgi:hypothetical protein